MQRVDFCATYACINNDDMQIVDVCIYEAQKKIYEPHREKTGFLPMRKQRRRSASR